MRMRSWKFRLYPSRQQENILDSYLIAGKDLWNALLEYSKKYYEETGKFPGRNRLNAFTKGTPLFSQVAQNVSDRLAKSIRGMATRKRAGMKAGFPRFKPIERMKSFTYPQFGFVLNNKLELSGIGGICIKKHREIQGKIKTLTVKKSPSRKWFAVFTSEVEKDALGRKEGPAAGMDLGIEHFAYLSDGTVIENPKHLKYAEERLRESQRRLSAKKKGGKNRKKARLDVAIIYEKLSNKRRDFLHKISRRLVEKYSFIAMENLNIEGMARSFLAKSVLDCGWAEFSGMLAYKAEEAGCEVVLVEPALTTQTCSKCGSVRKKSLAERWHECACGASLHRDLNAAINIFRRATAGHAGSQASGEETSAHQKWASVFDERGSPAL
ncbi:IS200/IS605 family element transposase accessory protein TnpB [Candidatus Micrarchaeota archaeon]|nr:IS200/IS605 family element transposase accessory protein TnpB [Candidatus Micrarchaeota archaeon]